MAKTSGFLCFFAKSDWKVIYVNGTGIANPSLLDIGRIITKKYLNIGSYRNPIPEGISRGKSPIYLQLILSNKVFYPSSGQINKESRN